MVLWMRKTMTFVELVVEDLTRLGGPMGTETTSEILRKAFPNTEAAKEWAEKDHKKRDNREPIRWVRSGKNGWCSGDLLSHMYTTEVRKIEEMNEEGKKSRRGSKQTRRRKS